jgi:hypothetical protein
VARSTRTSLTSDAAFWANNQIRLIDVALDALKQNDCKTARSTILLALTGMNKGMLLDAMLQFSRWSAGAHLRSSLYCEAPYIGPFVPDYTPNRHRKRDPYGRRSKQDIRKRRGRR